MKVYINYDRLKFLCKKNHMTLLDLSNRLQVARQTIYRWCLEGTEESNLLLLIDLFNCKREDLEDK